MKVGPDFRYISQVFSNISDKIWALGGGEVFGVIVLIWSHCFNLGSFIFYFDSHRFEILFGVTYQNFLLKLFSREKC
jgi:hypothetical protein